MKKVIISSIALAALLFTGCGTANSTNTSTPSPMTNQKPSSATNISTQPAKLKTQEVDLTVLPGEHLGPDGKKHDTFSPADFTVVEGVPVTLKVYNYDGGTHTVSNVDLGLNLQVKGHTKKGVPSVNTVTFTPTKAGDFTWRCLDKCDGGMTSYAMTHQGYMMGTIHVVPPNNQQFVTLTIKDGVQYASADGKLHDSFSPADFTVQKGIPVQVSVVNYDSGQHSISSPDLGLNQVFPGSKKDGDPTVTNFTFTPNKTGDFTWRCVYQCDGGMTSYSMTHQGYMMGTIHVES